jgi:predicted metal-dependent HD superfamily phosphohydrolase
VTSSNAGRASALSRLWPSSLAAQAPLRNRLVEAYGGQGRGYHDLLHLAEVLERVDQIVRGDVHDVDRDAVLLAAWFHDSVYDGRDDDEERSASFAERELRVAGVCEALVAEVARLVRLTATHAPAEDDRAGQVLCDADLAILAAYPARYRDYVAGVREEYRTVPEADFRRRRAALLRALESRPVLFRTAFARKHWESTARENVARELRELEDGS